MARPKYATGDIPAKLRLEEAFWTLIAQHPISEITVNMIVAKANCARGSFYYHFDDVSALVRSAIASNFPSQIPNMLLSFVATENVDAIAAIGNPEFASRIDRISLLVGAHSSVEAMELVKQTIRSAWIKALSLDETALTQETTLLLEFLISGIIGVLAYRSRAGKDFDIFAYIRDLLPVPQAIVKHIVRINGGENAREDSIQSNSG